MFDVDSMILAIDTVLQSVYRSLGGFDVWIFVVKFMIIVFLFINF